MIFFVLMLYIIMIFMSGSLFHVCKLYTSPVSTDRMAGTAVLEVKIPFT